MDSLSQLRSMVFAVGAAHLPGEKGLIYLLRKRGFEVEPVFASKKIKPENYKIGQVEIPWVNVDDPNGFYKVQMPGKPGDIMMYGILDMKMYFDLFNGTGYLAAGISTPYDKKTVDSLMDDCANNIFHGRSMLNGKDIVINGIHGKEFEKTDEDGYKHGFFLNKENSMYIAVGFASKKEPKAQQAVSKFLTSFQVFQKEPAAEKVYYTYVDSTLAYKIDVPSRPQSGNDLVSSQDKTIKPSIKICSDPVTGSYFLFGTNEAAPGYFFENDSILISNLRQNAKDKFATISFDTIYKQSNSLVLEITGIMKQAGVTMRTYYECRGNRWYALVALYDSTKYDPSIDRFFQSFKLLDYPSVAWTQQISKDSVLGAWAPSSFIYHNDKDSDITSSVKYESYDSTHSDTYDIVVEEFSKYYWQNSDSAFWNDVFKNNLADDSLLYRKPVTNGEVKGIEMLQQQRGSSQAKRKRMLLYGDKLYTLVTVQPEHNTSSANVNKFFEDFRFIKPASPSTIFTSKATKLIDDLSSPDSATWSDARAALFSAEFTVNDLPLLHKSLLETYQDSDVTYGSIVSTIANQIIRLKDSSSVKFAKDNYVDYRNASIRNYLLDIISAFKTRENYADLKDLLLKFPPGNEPNYSLQGNLKDSVALTRQMFPELLRLLKDSVMTPVILNVFRSLLDSSIVSISMLQPYQQDVMKFAERRFKILRNEDDYGSGDNSLIELLGDFSNAQCNAMLQKWLGVKPGYLKLQTITALLKNGQTVNVKVFNQLAADKVYRLDLYDGLKKYKKQSLFPKQYLTQQYFAEAMVYAASTDDDEPSGLTYLSQKVIPFKGKVARFFFYKVAYGEEEDKKYILACAGPFDRDPSKLSEDDATGSLYFEQNFDPLILSEHMNAVVRQMEGGYTQTK